MVPAHLAVVTVLSCVLQQSSAPCGTYCCALQARWGDPPNVCERLPEFLELLQAPKAVDLGLASASDSEASSSEGPDVDSSEEL
jgi:hypothetical protein